jgi:hypothetical protein
MMKFGSSKFQSKISDNEGAQKAGSGGRLPSTFLFETTRAYVKIMRLPACSCQCDQAWEEQRLKVLVNQCETRRNLSISKLLTNDCIRRECYLCVASFREGSHSAKLITQL